MLTKFQASQSVHITVDEQPVPIQHYLRQPQRLVYALFDPNRVESLSQGRFRLKLLPLSFMMLKIQPIVDLEVHTEADGTVFLQSTNCEIRGVEYLNQRFTLKLQGKLVPKQSLSGGTQLQGRADLDVQVELPPAFWLTPKPLIETTGNSLLRGILLTIKQRLMNRLVADYRQWVSDQLQTSAEATSQSSALSPQYE